MANQSVLPDKPDQPGARRQEWPGPSGRKPQTHRPNLHVLGPGDPDHLDLESAYHIRSGQIVRAVTRQLFCYPPSGDLADPARAFSPVPDVAEDHPTLANGGLSADGRTYTFRLRSDVFWDADVPRKLTAQDFIRGFERIAEPVTPHDIRGYFIQTIVGMKAYCDDYERDVPGSPPSPEALAAFRSNNRISGLTARDDGTLIVRLLEPANDFLNLLALGYAVALPEETEGVPLGSEAFRRRYVSSGPYRIVSGKNGSAEPVADQRAMVLAPNPVWRQASDPIRSQAIGAIRSTAGNYRCEAVREGIRTGEIDPAWPFAVVSWDGSVPAGSAFPAIYPGFTLNPYLVFNMSSPNADGALRQHEVRQAVACAIDKAAIGDLFAVLHGVAVEPLHSVLPPSTLGHRQFDFYPTPQSRGDREKARACLKRAGHADGLTLKAAVRDIDLHQSVMDIIADNLAACGIATERETYTQRQYYGELLSDPERADAGDWDIAVAGWTPDWFGNNGRAVFKQLFRTDLSPGTMNFGCYSNPVVDDLIDRALAAQDLAQAADLWHAADRQVMSDLPVVPILSFACQCCAARTGANGWLTWAETL